MTRLVAILAHPDDAEILAGGTLYQHRQRGDSVEICSVTYTPDSVRGQEGAAGAQRLGAEFTCLGLPDMGVSRYTPEDVERLTACLLARPPDMRRSKHSRQGVCSHQGLRKASAADPVNTGLAGSTGMAAFDAAPAGKPVLRAVDYLKSIQGRRKPQLDEAPLDIVDASWKRLVMIVTRASRHGERPG